MLRMRGAGRRQGKMGPLRPVGDAARLDHMAEEAQVDEIECMGRPSLSAKAGKNYYKLHRKQAWSNLRG
jgi:hypothetical protein